MKKVYNKVQKPGLVPSINELRRLSPNIITVRLQYRGLQTVIFNSHEFLFVFLPCCLVVYLLLNRWHLTVASTSWLIICSFIFYGWAEPRYVLLLAFSIIFNYCFGIALIKCGQQLETRRRLLLTLGIAVNVVLLGYYKYTDFLIINVNYAFGTGFRLKQILLPVGISFITFTQIAYLVDLYRSPNKHFDLLNYSLFIAFFPKLLAGPIARYDEVMPQLQRLKNKVLNYQNLSLGLYLFSIGLFKKVVIADRFGEFASTGFDTTATLNLLQAWATTLSYTFQIYFDFSGYTDMALGSALFFNIKLPINFNSPYKSLSIQDFWRRWHVTLSRFLRDYIYIPLGGNRVAEVRVLMNLMITFLIGGLWHGAGWTFVFWGFMHGIGLIAHRIWSKTGRALPRSVAWFINFNYIAIAWVFFRARTWDDAIRVLKGMFGLTGVALPESWSKSLYFLTSFGVQFAPWKRIMEGSRDSYLWIFAALFICLIFKNSNQMAERFKPDWKALIVIAAGAYAALHMFQMQEFLYFNF